MNKGYFLIFSTAIISGFSIFINKFGVGIFKNPYLFTFLKNVVVAIFLSSLLIFFKDWQKLEKIKKKEWLLLILIGLVGGSIPFLLFFKGLSLTSSAEASFVHKTLFIWTAILAAIFLKEKLERKFLLGGTILLFANFILLKKLPLQMNYGNLLVFLATLLWAIENTISKNVLKTLSGREVAWGRMFFGSIFILIYLIFTHQLSPISSLNIKQIEWIFITSFLLFGYVLTWYSGLKYVPLHQASAILLFGSFITTFLNLISGGKVSENELISGFLIVVGVIFILGIKKIFEILKSLKDLIYVRI